MTAQPIYCDSDHQAIADMMVTNLHNGDTQSYCVACAPAALRAIAVTLDPPVVPEVAADAPPEAAAGDGEGGRASAHRPRSRGTQAATVAAGPDDTGTTPTTDDATADDS